MSPNEKFPLLLNDRILRAAKGEPVDRLPVWVMRQAGRYLPEFKEYRTEHNFFEICETPEQACHVTLMPLKRFDLDAAIIFSDILVIPKAMGMVVEMVPGTGPHFPEPLTLNTRLNKSGVAERLKYVGEAISLTRHKLQGRIPIFGFSGAPWTLFSYMVEGGGSKTYSKAKKWLYSHPEIAHDVLKSLTEAIVDYLVMQIEYGAQIVQVFESNAEYLNSSLFSQFCAPYLKQITEDVKKKLKEKDVEEVPMVLFAKGGWYCLEEQTKLGYNVLGIDWTVNPEFVKEIVKDKKITIQGNLDPCALYAPEKDLQNMITKMLQKFKGINYIVNLGHGIYPDAPVESVKTLVETVHNFSH